MPLRGDGFCLIRAEAQGSAHGESGNNTQETVGQEDTEIFGEKQNSRSG
jgi:hypothetical protein